MKNDNKPHQLLIIGNGFDLYCGLNSRFSDYVKSAYKEDYISPFNDFGSKIDSYYNDSKLYIRAENNKNTLHPGVSQKISEFKNLELELILYIVSGRNIILWQDFEGSLYKLVAKRGPSHDEISLWEEAFYRYTNVSVPYEDSDFAKQIAKMCFLFDLKKGGIVTNIDEWNNKLTNLLKSFEQKFSSYLDVEFEKTKKSEEKAYDNKKDFLLINIIKDKTIRTNILSFNYTTPLFTGINTSEKDIEHVHGKLSNTGKGNKIIVGIDSTRLKTSSFGYELSKTFRKAEAYSFNNQKGDEVNNVLSNGTPKIIKFFGHSLNEQDYSYFQSIFDVFDLYNSEVKLEFFFSIYKGAPAAKIRNNAIKSIVFLIDNYGASLYNKDQGKNLLHKLLLQKRVSIIEIPDYSVVFPQKSTN